MNFVGRTTQIAEKSGRAISAMHRGLIVGKHQFGVRPSNSAELFYTRLTMKITTICLICTVVMVCSVASTLHAEILEKTGTFAGLKVTYKVVLPAAYDAAKAHPLVLVFTGGPQTLQIATSTVETD